MGTSTARASWSGAVSFGMVSFPIKLYGAVTDRNVRFKQVHRPCGGTTNAETVCRTCEKTVDRADIVKGFEIAKGEVIVLEEQEMAELPLNSTKVVEIFATMPADDLPVAMIEKTYWMGPDDKMKIGHKAFALFRDALERSGEVAIGRIAMRSGKEDLCAIRPHGKALMFTRLYWGDELVSPVAIEETVSDVVVSEAEADLADQLIASLSRGPAVVFEQRDAYREAVEALVDAKMQGKEVVHTPQPPKPEVDLMAALRASVEATKAA